MDLYVFDPVVLGLVRYLQCFEVQPVQAPIGNDNHPSIGRNQSFRRLDQRLVEFLAVLIGISQILAAKQRLSITFNFLIDFLLARQGEGLDLIRRNNPKK